MQIKFKPGEYERMFKTLDPFRDTPKREHRAGLSAFALFYYNRESVCAFAADGYSWVEGIFDAEVDSEFEPFYFAPIKPTSKQDEYVLERDVITTLNGEDVTIDSKPLETGKLTKDFNDPKFTIKLSTRLLRNLVETASVDKKDEVTLNFYDALKPVEFRTSNNQAHGAVYPLR